MDDTKKYPLPQRVKNKHTDDLIDHYWGAIRNLTLLIKNSELKAGLILSFYGILFNMMYRGLDVAQNTGPSPIVLYVLLGLWGLSTIASIFFAVRCFIPRLELQYDKNVFFFRDVISEFGGIREFAKTFHTISVDEDLLFDQLGQHIFVLSKITTVKFKNVQRSLRFLALGLAVMLPMVLYLAIGWV